MRVRSSLLFWLCAGLLAAGGGYLALRPRDPKPEPLAREAPGKVQELWFHSGYGGGLKGSGGLSALTGPTKMPALFEGILRHQMVVPGNLHADAPGAQPPAPPIDLESLRAAHTDRYLHAVLTGKPEDLALSQGLPRWEASVARGWLLNLGGLSAAARRALEGVPITANLAHGYHHAVPDRGMGFCTLHGLAVVAKQLVREGKARRILIVDLDHHEGNGTGAILLGEPGIWNLTLYGHPHSGPPGAENHLPVRIRHEDLARGEARDIHYLSAVAELLPPLLDRVKPDLVLYQAGMDPYDSAGITPRALGMRDAFVFALARSRGIPVTWVLAGGYADLETLVALHLGTVRAANQVLERVQPGQSLSMDGQDPYRWASSAGRVQFPDWRTQRKGPLKTTPAWALEPDGVVRFAAERAERFQEQRMPEAALKAAYEAVVGSGASAGAPRRSGRRP